MKSTISVLLLTLIVFFAFTFINIDGRKNLSKRNTNVSNKNLVVKGPTLDHPLSSLSESFEGATFPPAGWIKLDPDGGTGWASIVAGTTPLPGWNGGVATVPTGGGTQTAYASWNTGGASANDQWLVTPQIMNVQASDSLSFWLRKPGYAGAYLDHFDVKISTTTPTVANFTITVVATTNPANSSDTNWTQYKFRLGDFVSNGASIYIGFREWVLDNLNDGSAYQLDLVSVYPAPVTNSWSEQTTGTANSLYSVSVVNDNVAWTCGATGKVYRTTNSGGSWPDVSGNLPTANPFYCIYAYSVNTAIAVTSPAAGGSANVWQTNNGGTNWTNVYSYTGSAAFGDALWMTDSLNEYYMGDPQGGNWDLKKSSNGGANWATWATVPTTASGGWNNGMFFYDANHVWFGTNSTFIMYSSNAGTNWVQQTTPSTNSYLIWFNSLTNGFGADNNLYTTTNGGTNWTANTSPIAANIGGLCGGGNEWWACPQALTIYYSSNNGSNWALQYTSTTAGVIYHMSRARTGSVIFAVKSNGTIVRYGPPLTGITPIGNITPTQYNLSQNYPNPFNPTTKINYSLPKSGLVTLKIYNILGQEVNTLVNEVKSAGVYSVDFNASNLSSGIYFYTIKSGDFTDVKKMSLIK